MESKEIKIINLKHKRRCKTKTDSKGRVCTKCCVYKTWDNYGKCNKASVKLKFTSACKECLKSRMVGRKRDSKKENLRTKELKSLLKTIDPFLVKSRRIRTNLLNRFKDKENKALTPPTAEIKEWLENQPIICYYSGEVLNLDTLTIDHKQPIDRGGTNELDNLCICSHKMNSSKGKMSEKEFTELLSLLHTWEDGGYYVLARLRQGWAGGIGKR